MGLDTGAIFIIFAVSAAGTLVPVISQRIPKCNTNTIFMEAIRAFSFGVVLATGLIHMVNEGIEKLSDEALGPIVEEYGCLGLAIVLITMIVLQFIEAESVIFFAGGGSMLHGHGHSHGPGDLHTNDSDESAPESPSGQDGAYVVAPADISLEKKTMVHNTNLHRSSLDHGHSHTTETVPASPTDRGETKLSAEKKTAAHNANIRRRIATIIFEAGVIFHSIIVGLDLGVTTGPKFNTLLTALCFHQFFEGVAIGSAAVTTTQSKRKLFLINFAFAITTPIGQAIGIGIRSSYSSESTTALWVQGVFDCIAGGILLYTGLVELLTYNMTTNQKFLGRSTPQRYALYACLWSGAGLMALIGKWS
ncbi:zinc transporter ZIP protein [Phytophthora sojae]|uniref:Zinc transporter ZIP protein n=1 Tax=Phytophthora sojae (strain P6497) TaxID=1094619 RepID=G4Z5V4_PHYSP|nr:zinc transporter ZIP protein [Phytophthora sojae]EGZ19537.1 zinc transporter ZIP protein [Phytophthora sojae]|eukprot:XP_009522254.1 zinc transporter ZIP protein [Phytophthora sojae]